MRGTGREANVVCVWLTVQYRRRAILAAACLSRVESHEAKNCHDECMAVRLMDGWWLSHAMNMCLHMSQFAGCFFRSDGGQVYHAVHCM